MNGRCQGFYCGADSGLRITVRAARPAMTRDRRRADRRRRTCRPDRRRRTAAGSCAASWCWNAKRAPAASPATVTTSATACVTCGTFVSGPSTRAARRAGARRRGDIRTGSHGHRLGRGPGAGRHLPRGREPSTRARWCWPPVRANDPRPARLIPGDRPTGSTPPASCRISYIWRTARSAGAPSWSAPNWSASQRCSPSATPVAATALMTTDHPSPESYAVFNLAGRHRCSGSRWRPGPGDPDHRLPHRSGRRDRRPRHRRPSHRRLRHAWC